MSLRMIFHSALCIVASLLMTQCPERDEYRECYCSLDIFNDTDYPIALQMNFDPQRGKIYTFGEMRYIIPEGSFYSIVERRFIDYKSGHGPFNSIWRTPDDKVIYCRLYSLNPETYKEKELLVEWVSSSPSDEFSFFNERAWSYDSFSSIDGFYRWIFNIDENMDGIPVLNE